jgi:diaminopimelate decarboxylase
MFENPRFALYQAKYSVVPAERMNELATKTYTLAGKCCESGDIIAENVSLPEIKEGEILAVLSTGAYNYSMASNYNRNLVPAAVMTKDGEDYLAVKGQTYEDLLKNDL